jgi:hypothetical protein
MWKKREREGGKVGEDREREKERKEEKVCVRESGRNVREKIIGCRNCYKDTSGERKRVRERQENVAFRRERKYLERRKKGKEMRNKKKV